MVYWRWPDLFVFTGDGGMASYTFIALGGRWWLGGVERRVCLEGSSLKYAKGANIRQLHTNGSPRKGDMLVLSV